MTDIVLNGVSIADLKAKRLAIRQEAVAFVAKAVKQGRATFEKLMEAESQEEANRLAAEALADFDNASLVAGVAGVTFDIPFYEEYGSYDSDEIMTSRMDDGGNQFLEIDWSDKANPIRQLYDLLGDMESQSRDWHSSRC